MHGHHMRNMYAYGGEPARRNLTVTGLRAFTAKRIFSQVAAYTETRDPAAAAAGVDIVAIDRSLTAEVREGEPEAFMHAAVGLTANRSEVAVVEAAFEAMNDGADAAYTLHSLPMVAKLAEF